MIKYFGIDTKLLLFSGEIKRIQDVIKGDILMGIGSVPHTVVETIPWVSLRSSSLRSPANKVPRSRHYVSLRSPVNKVYFYVCGM
jgi:hypothetical protein